MKRILLPFVIALINTIAIAQAPVIEYQLKAGGLSEPVDIAHAGDGSNRLFIVQRTGLIRIWDGNTMLAEPFLNVGTLLNLASSERGLLSMAFHPNYASNRYFFIYYTNTSGNLTLARYRTLAANPNVADAASGTVLLSINHTSNSNHNGGKLNFGTDGYLYFGTGDGGGSNDLGNNAQTGTSLLGKMLRIDVNDFADVTPPLYSIPNTNPYVSVAGINNEVIALGVRNPWRWSFDRLTGDMWIADVGQAAREEVNFRPKDSILKPTNYGWRCLEGKITNPTASVACPPPADNVFPIFDYGHNGSGGYSITGGYVYRGSEFPALNGYYTCTDYVTGNTWLIKSNGAGGWDVTAQTVNKLNNLSSYGEDENGVLYALQLTAGTTNSGSLYKVITSSTLPLQLVSFTATKQQGQHVINWTTAFEEAGNEYVLERSLSNTNSFKEIDRRRAAIAGTQNYTSTSAAQGDAYYRLQMINRSGTVSYSPVILIKENSSRKQVFTAYRSASRIHIMLQEPARSIRVYNAVGAELYQQSFNDQSGFITVPVPNQRSILFVQVITATGTQTKKVAF